MTGDNSDFEARRQEVIANMPAQPRADLLAQARDDIDNLFDSSVDWLSFNQSDPRFEKARASFCRIEALALLGYSVLLERTKA